MLAPGSWPTITPGFDAESLALTTELTRIMVLAPLFLAAGAVATSVLNARGRFGAAAMAPLVYNLAIIGGALFLVPVFGVAGLALGVVLGCRGPPARPAPDAAPDRGPDPAADRPGRPAGAAGAAC